MNDQMGDEICFERWLWSYVPCHWKGWAILLLYLAPSGAVIGLLVCTAHLLAREWITDLVVIPFILALFSLNRIAKRHSRSFSG